MVSITKRPATDNDKDMVRDIHHAAYRPWVVEQFGPWNQHIQDKFFDESWSKLGYMMLEEEGIPCGYIALTVEVDGLHVRELAIAPDFQGRGIGSTVFRELKSDARVDGLPIKLRAFRKNFKAIEFYKHIGFKVVGLENEQILFEWCDNA